MTTDPTPEAAAHVYCVSEIRDGGLRRIHGYHATLQGAFDYCEAEERKKPLIDTVRFELFPAPGGEQWLVQVYAGLDAGDWPETSDLVISRHEVADERPAAPSVSVVSGQTLRDRVAEAPVKQRADCTELEWAEQERARFERLYTRESVRADTAVRDAEIYQQRLERLGEGYTRERKRAERAEAEAERLRTYRDATCICQHTEQQHFEDSCLVCDCGDYLVPVAAREVIARWREAAVNAKRIRENADFHLGQEMARRQLAEKETARLAADRATALNAAAQHLYTALFPAVYADMGQKAAEGVNRAVSELRRLAAEAPQPEPDAGVRQQPDTETPSEEQTVRDHVTTVHLIGEQLAGIESWLWERLAEAREQAVQHAPGRAICCPDCRAKGHAVCLAAAVVPAAGAGQDETQEAQVVGYSGKGRVWCLQCPRPDDENVPVGVDLLQPYEQCAGCHREVVEVARAVEERQS